MAELPALPDVVRSAADVTDPPPFEAIVRRGRQRRRRQLLASVVVAVVAVLAVVAGVAFAGHDIAARPVERPSPSVPTPSASAAERIIAHAGVADYSADDQGDLLTLWTTCLNGTPGGEHCHNAWKLNTRGLTFTGLLPDDSGPGVSSGNGGFVIIGSHGLADVVLLDGSTHHLRRVANLAPYPGELLVMAYGSANIADAKTERWSPLRTSTGIQLAQGLVDAETTWAEELTRSGATLAWRRDAGPWHTHLISGGDTTTGPVAAVGDHVAASSGLVADDYNPLAVWSVSTDSGRTWTSLDASAMPFSDATEMAATPGGTLYVHSLVDGTFRSTDQTWTHFVKVPGLDTVSDLKPVSDAVAMLTWQHGKPLRIVKLDDAGHVRDWPTPLS